jgi:ribosome biogenesis GTPase
MDPVLGTGPVALRPGVATVCRIDFGSVRLMADDGSDFEASVPAKLRGARKALGNAVVTGDRVTLVWDHERALVERVEPRRNVFSRRAAGERDDEQVVSANLDQVAIVAALQRPDFSPGLVDRVLVQCERATLPALLVLNKTDLDSRHESDALLAEYTRAGVRGLTTCAVSGHGVDDVRAACDGRRTLFVGHSGVGKSTLLARLMPQVVINQGEVNVVTGKGRHTTSAAVLYRPGGDIELVDTPGVRAFALWGVEPDELVEYWPELRPLVGGCRFGDCRHDREPGCALRAAVERGEVGERRFASYCKLRDELAEGFH